MSRLGARTRLTGAGYTSRVAQWQQPSFVKSVQRGTITVAHTTTSGTATIAAVDVNNAVLKYGGSDWNGGTGNTPDDAYCRLILTNSTTITAGRSGNLNVCLVPFEVIEYWPGILLSVQRGSIDIAAGTQSQTATVTSVDVAKSELSWLGSNTPETTPAFGFLQARIVLTASNTITASRQAGSGTVALSVGWQLVEWY